MVPRAIRKIADQLRRVQIRVSASTVRRLLKQMGFSLRVNHKRLESGNKNPPPRRVRNRQFTYIDRQRKRFTARAHPIISVDAKKKEWIGKFKNSGISWEQQPQLVNDHDFPSDAVGRAIPYGVYDPRRNQGFVVVGTSRETPAFAVDAITLWWKSCGQKRYPKAKPSHVPAKVPYAVLPQSPSQARPERTECRTHPCGCGNKATESSLGLSANR